MEYICLEGDFWMWLVVMDFSLGLKIKDGCKEIIIFQIFLKTK